MSWYVFTTLSTRTNRAGYAENRLTVVLTCGPDLEHPLSGAHGRRVLEATAEHWNELGYQPDLKPCTTRCRADYSTDSARAKFSTHNHR